MTKRTGGCVLKNISKSMKVTEPNRVTSPCSNKEESPSTSNNYHRSINNSPNVKHSKDGIILFASTYNPSHIRLNQEFFSQSCQDLAKCLLGKILVRDIDGTRVSGIIVETESYLGGEDKASHSFNGKRTPRNEPMYMKAGTSYVYPIYGMYYCFNISSEEEGSCVLVRGLQPIEGLDIMHKYRQANSKLAKTLKSKHLCNGPSKLCQALSINKNTCNKLDLATSTIFWLEEGLDVNAEDIISCKRIGIESSGEIWSNKPLRFYIFKNECVSVRDKTKERNHKC